MVQVLLVLAGMGLLLVISLMVLVPMHLGDLNRAQGRGRGKGGRPGKRSPTIRA
jgi:hypothetical protein